MAPTVGAGPFLADKRVACRAAQLWPTGNSRPWTLVSTPLSHPILVAPPPLATSEMWCSTELPTLEISSVNRSHSGVWGFGLAPPEIAQGLYDHQQLTAFDAVVIWGFSETTAKISYDPFPILTFLSLHSHNKHLVKVGESKQSVTELVKGHCAGLVPLVMATFVCKGGVASLQWWRSTCTRSVATPSHHIYHISLILLGCIF